MTRQETGRVIPSDPGDVVMDSRFLAAIYRGNPVNVNIRRISSRIRASLLELKENGKLTPAERKNIADATGDVLRIIKENITGRAAIALDGTIKDSSVYPTYARMDILAGLGEFKDPNMQLVIAKSLDDPAEMVRELSEKLLTRPNVEIFTETFEFLINVTDPKNLDSEKTELALSIVEKNEKAGLRDNDPDVVVKEMLLDVLSGVRAIHGGKHRAAVLVGRLCERLQKRMSEDNVIRGIMLASYNKMEAESTAIYLFSEIGEELEKLKLRDNFNQLVNAVYSNNLSSAKTTDDIPTMVLSLPPEHEAIGVLRKIFDYEALRYNAALAEYKDIRALAAQGARKMLQENIADAREKERQGIEQRRNEESQLAERKRQEREASLKTQKDEQIRAINEEGTRAELARNLFPYLSRSF